MTDPTSPATAALPRAGRLRLTAYAAAQVALAVPALLALVLTVVGGATLLVTVGVVLLCVSIPLTRWLAQQHRRMAARVLGRPESRPYRPLPAGVWGRAGTIAADPMTYRDLGWTLWASTLGFAFSLLCLLELLVVVLLPLWWWTQAPKMRARAHVDLWFLAPSRTEGLEQRVQQLTETRADVVDHSAAELRRLERDLHDGPQARLVALSMSLGMADQALAAGDDADPDAVRRLVSDARATTQAAIGDLRSVVRGIHPPVLADRGLGGAVEALALDMAFPVQVVDHLDVRAPAPVESALYFAVAECLANIGKHAGARTAWVTLGRTASGVRAVVVDDGRGGAAEGAGSGLAGIRRRLAAFDGTMMVSSPVDGPTEITLEVPCESSSPRTTPSSGRG